MKSFRWQLLSVLILVLLSAGFTRAQNTTGTVVGTVTDSSGAIIAGASVTATNERTSLERSTQTNEQGVYRFPLLLTGSYAVTVSMEGFRTQTQTGVTLEILQTRAVDFSLDVGAITESVTVETTAPLIETETSQAGEVITGKQITDLPLGARQFMRLVFLVPMATPASRDFRSTEINRETAMPAAAGQRPEQNNYQIDGVDNRESGRNSLAVSASVEAVGEFRVQTGLAPAEFGRGGGVILNVATKSGTNEWHGSLYEFLRNNSLDSRPFFSSRVNPLKRNQYGGSLGGPIVRDKLFFFANYEGFREAASGNPPVGIVFTQAQRQGDLSSTTAALKDPLNGGAPFANNQIPATRLDPISQNILKLIPPPNNNDPLRNFVFNGVPSGTTRRDFYVGRIDYNIGDNDVIYGRYLIDDESLRTPPSLPEPANSGGRDLELRAQTASISWNRVITPTVINTATLAFSRYHNALQTLNSFKADLIAPTGITNTLSAVEPLFWAAPSVSVPGFVFPGEVTPNFRTMNTWQLQESISWSRGSHNLKAGFEGMRTNTWMFYTGGNGSTAFANRYTGDNAADYLLGFASSANKTARATRWDSGLSFFGGYIQDDWKITPRLTLNIGVRYDVQTALRQADNGGSNFDVHTGTLIAAESATNRDAIANFYANIRTDIPLRFRTEDSPYDADMNNVAPRFGFAYRLHDRMVLRGGYGLFYDAPQIASLASTNDFPPNTLRPIWTASPTVPDLGYNPEGAVAAEETLRNAPLTAFPFLSRKFPYGKIQQWNLNIQHQLSPTLVFETMYQGSSGVNLLVFDNNNFRAPGPGNVQQQLPYRGFARIQSEDMWGRSWYHGGAVKVEQRPAAGLSYLLSYTFSKSQDLASTLNQGPQWVDPFNRRTAKGRSDFDIEHRFTLAYNYELPVGKGRHFGNGWSGVADKILGGWGVRGVTTFQTGFALSPTMNLSRNGTCATACSARPDRIADGNMLSDARSIQRYFDLTAFRLLAAGGAERRVGNGGRNTLIAPGLGVFDIQAFKNTTIAEGHSIEFRWEFLNAFNKANFGFPGTNAEAANTFGVISGTGDPRIMQVALRYSF